MQHLTNDQLLRHGWAYVARNEAGEVVAICADGFPKEAKKFLLEQVEAGHTVSRTTGDETGDRA